MYQLQPGKNVKFLEPPKIKHTEGVFQKSSTTHFFQSSANLSFVSSTQFISLFTAITPPTHLPTSTDTIICILKVTGGRNGKMVFVHVSQLHETDLSLAV